MRWIPMVLVLWALAAGCGTTTKEEIGHDTLADLPELPPPPHGYKKVRSAVVEFQDRTGRHGWYAAPIGAQGGEKFETIVVNSGRFNMIERLRLGDVVAEQSLGGTVDPAEIAKAGRVRGVDYLFFGAVTNFSVKITKTDKGFDIFGRVLKPLAPVDIDTSKTVMETVVDVDIKLVNTTSGEIVAKHSGEMKNVRTAKAWGMKIFDIGGSARNEVKIDADSQGRILQWAMHEAYRKMLPVIDAKFSREQPSYCPACKVELAAGQNFCAKCGQGTQKAKCTCGADLEPGTRFCGKCGAKVAGVQPLPVGAAPPPPGPGPASPAGDYMPENYLLAFDGSHWQVCIMKTQPSGEKKEAEFVTVNTGRSFWSAQFATTRPARAEDIKVGATVYVPNVDSFQASHKSVAAVVKSWKSEFSHWDKVTVTGTLGIEGGIFQAPLDGNKDVHFSNARVPRDK